MMAQDTQDEDISCNLCGCQDDCVFCEGCNTYYCGECWDKLRTHRLGGAGPTGVPHGKSDIEIVRKVKKWMAEPVNVQDEQIQHEQDESTLWIGLSQEAGEPALADYRRYATIMMESSQELEQSSSRYPSLVSFVGPTGSGKSTLIRLLIDSTNPDVDRQSTVAPIIGRHDCEVPTSADVHLYLDPTTASGKRPMLFADCEGFEGGEQSPIAQKSLFSADKSQDAPSDEFHGPRALQTLGKVAARATKRALKWASRNATGFEQKSKRQYAVSEMYPRIFHSFSDVIVFVLNNPKTMEDVLEKLLHWADSNHSKCINLPSKPHAIIALNKSNTATDTDQWTCAKATEDFLKSMSGQIHRNQTFRDYVLRWETAGHPIYDMKELLERYYSTIRVIRVPEKSRYELLHNQRDKLYKVITECSDQSFRKKRDIKMLPNVDEFGLYLSLAFDHFSDTLDEPFDYIKASMKYRPPPATLKDNIVGFILLIAQKSELQSEVSNLFDRITPIVASCLLLEAARKRRVGTPTDWFNTDFAKPSPKSGYDNPTNRTRSDVNSYRKLCESVVLEYFDKHVRCDYSFPASILRGRRSKHQCDLFQNTHFEMHRQSSTWGVKEAFGSFHSSFNPEAYSWENKVLNHMRYLTRLSRANNNLFDRFDATTSTSINTESGSRAAQANVHREELAQFYRGTVSNSVFCNCICLGCLVNAPTYKLGCGHSLCFECVVDFGHRLDDCTRITIDNCIICNSILKDEIPQASGLSDTIHVDPPRSGLRVLVLDGGGVRGIIELCIMKAIEDELGAPLQRFFDLVVGTSTGGIIALGFGHELWSLDECREKFEALVPEVFTRRPGLGHKDPFRHIGLVLTKSKYKTLPLEQALQKAFNDSSPLFAPLLFEQQDRTRHSSSLGTTSPPPSDRVFLSSVKSRQSLKESGLTSQSLFSSESESPGLVGFRRSKVAVTATSGAGKKAYLLANYNVGNNSELSNLSDTTPIYTRHRPWEDSNELRVWEAARATSAAPGFFRPFSKKQSTSSQPAPDIDLMDGGILHNNPIRIAVEEARRLALERGLSKIPDIVLSLGTGLPKDFRPSDESDDDTSRAFSMAQSMIGSRKKITFFRMLFTMVRYQMELNLNCEKRWNEWKSECVHDVAWKNRLYRLNPDLQREPPVMDDIDEVEPLYKTTRRWTYDPSVRAQIREIACVLVASSFYFVRTGTVVLERASKIEVQGFIRCRLSETPDDVRALGKFLQNRCPVALVVSGNYPGKHREEEIPMPIEEMIAKGKFGALKASVTVAGDETILNIQLRLTGNVRRNFPISGFPRKLIERDYQH